MEPCSFSHRYLLRDKFGGLGTMKCLPVANVCVLKNHFDLLSMLGLKSDKVNGI